MYTSRLDRSLDDLHAEGLYLPLQVSGEVLMPLLERFARPAWVPGALCELRWKRRVLGQESHAHRQGLAVREVIEETTRRAVWGQAHQVALFARAQEIVDEVIELTDREAGERQFFNDFNLGSVTLGYEPGQVVTPAVPRDNRGFRKATGVKRRRRMGEVMVKRQH